MHFEWTAAVLGVGITADDQNQEFVTELHDKLASTETGDHGYHAEGSERGKKIKLDYVVVNAGILEYPNVRALLPTNSSMHRRFYQFLVFMLPCL